MSTRDVFKGKRLIYLRWRLLLRKPKKYLNKSTMKCLQSFKERNQFEMFFFKFCGFFSLNFTATSKSIPPFFFKSILCASFILCIFKQTLWDQVREQTTVDKLPKIRKMNFDKKKKGNYPFLNIQQPPQNTNIQFFKSKYIEWTFKKNNVDKEWAEYFSHILCKVCNLGEKKVHLKRNRVWLRHPWVEWSLSKATKLDNISLFFC